MTKTDKALIISAMMHVYVDSGVTDLANDAEFQELLQGVDNAVKKTLGAIPEKNRGKRLTKRVKVSMLKLYKDLMKGV